MKNLTSYCKWLTKSYKIYSLEKNNEYFIKIDWFLETIEIFNEIEILFDNYHY